MQLFEAVMSFPSILFCRQLDAEGDGMILSGMGKLKSVQGGDGFRDRNTQAATGGERRGRFISGFRGVDAFRQLRFIHRGTAVGNAEHAAGQCHVDEAVGIGVLHRIVDQVFDRPLHQTAVGGNGTRTVIRRKRDAFIVGQDFVE